jgi:DNA (cytosine-5)-methyltransferase 1
VVNKYSAVSLFSGAGGMDIGFAKANFDIVFANDIDQAACDSYNLNHPISSLCGDIRDFKNSISSFKGVDIVFGGPPCQGFSVAGKMDPNDERSQLIWSYLEQVELLKPKAFVCENVKALAVNSRWEYIRNGLIARAENLGYTTALLVLNASHFGVPQARERMFLIGIKKSKKKISSDSLQAALYFVLYKQKKKPLTISKLIQKLGPPGSKNNSRICSAIITFAKNPVLRKSPYAGMLFNGAGRPINSNGIALTLPASMGGNKTPIVDDDEIFNNTVSFVKKYHNDLIRGKKPKTGAAPSRLRRITIDEALAIQTFPDTYEMAGSQSAIYRQIGNAVPSKLAEVVAKAVHEILDDGIEAFTSNFR